jgi:hypothetical protein
VAPVSPRIGTSTWDTFHILSVYILTSAETRRVNIPTRRRIDREADIVVGGPRRPLMNGRDTDRAEAIRVIAEILAAAYLRLRFPETRPNEVDCAVKNEARCQW